MEWVKAGWVDQEGHDRAEQSFQAGKCFNKSMWCFWHRWASRRKMDFRDCPQQGMGKSWRCKLERNILVDAGWLNGTGCLRQNCPGKPVDNFTAAILQSCFFLFYHHPVPWYKRGTVQLVAENQNSAACAKCCWCRMQHSAVPLGLLVPWASSHFVISHRLMY